MKRLDFVFWLMKQRRDYWGRKNVRSDIRREIRQRLESGNSTGKGNRAWKRADAAERAWRSSGGFYVSDFIPA